MTNWAQLERGLLCDLFLETGPDAPTLCGQWTTRDLAAHLVIREGRPDAAPGILVPLPLLTRWTEKVQGEIAAQPWPTLVDAVRNGPPLWSPTRIPAVDELINTVEFFVHHEDVRRAAPAWEPRTLDGAQEAALGKALSRAKLLARRCPTGLVLHRPDGTTLVAKSGEPHVDAAGPNSELLLFVYGRQAQARVELTGTDADIAAVREASFGI